MTSINHLFQVHLLLRESQCNGDGLVGYPAWRDVSMFIAPSDLIPVTTELTYLQCSPSPQNKR